LQQAKLYIRMRHLTFPKDKDEFRVSYILSHLRSGPVEWGQALLESGSPLLKDHDAFLAKFTSIYENKEHHSQLEDCLARLKQVGSASTYSAEFSSLCAILSIDPDTRMGDFRLGLKSGVQDSLALLPVPTTFEALSTCAIRIDNAQYSARKNIETHHNNPSSKSQQRPSQQQSSNSSRPPPSRPPPVPNYASNPPASHPGSTRSSAPYSRLTDEEKERRKCEKLCGYCGDPNHTIENCPGVAAKNAKKTCKRRTLQASSLFNLSRHRHCPSHFFRRLSLSQLGKVECLESLATRILEPPVVALTVTSQDLFDIQSLSSSSLLYVPVSFPVLSVSTLSCVLKALIDCGASINLINEALCSLLSIPVTPCQGPLVTLADGVTTLSCSGIVTLSFPVSGAFFARYLLRCPHRCAIHDSGNAFP